MGESINTGLHKLAGVKDDLKRRQLHAISAHVSGTSAAPGVESARLGECKLQINQHAHSTFLHLMKFACSFQLQTRYAFTSLCSVSRYQSCCHVVGQWLTTNISVWVVWWE